LPAALRAACAGRGAGAHHARAGPGHLFAAYRRFPGRRAEGARRGGPRSRRRRYGVAAAGESAYLLLPQRGAPDMKPINQRAWLLVLPVVICVAFSAILPLMTIVNYSVQDIIASDRRVFVGTEWYAMVLQDEELHGALLRQIGFSLAVLAIEVPLGILLGLC